MPTDGRAPVWVGDVADRGEQRRVDHRGAGAEQRGAERPRPEAGGRGDPADRDGLGEHAADDEPLAADAVGECAGDELAEPPDRGVERGEDADAADGEPGGGEVEREEAPGEAVVEVVDEPGLAARRERRLREAREDEHLAGARARRGGARWR